MHLQRIYEVFDRIFMLKQIYYCLDIASLIQYIKTSKIIYNHKTIIYNLITQYTYFYRNDLKRWMMYDSYHFILPQNIYGKEEDKNSIEQKVKQNYHLRNKQIKS